MKLDHYRTNYYRDRCVTTRTPFTPESGLARIHKICGCAGRYDCDCVSVVNMAHIQLWTEHNTADERSRN